MNYRIQSNLFAYLCGDGLRIWSLTNPIHLTGIVRVHCDSKHCMQNNYSTAKRSIIVR